MHRPVVREGYALHPWSGTDLHGIQIGEVLVDRETRYQHLFVTETTGFGRALFLDGAFQSCEADEHRYHEALVTPALVLHPRPRSVLVLGGGEGATAREVLRDPGVQRVRMVDLDEEVVDVCRSHLPSMSAGSFDDPRLTLEFADALEVIEACRDQDLIIHDLSDPQEGSPSYSLFGEAFFRSCEAALSQDGLLVIQAGPLRLTPDRHTEQALRALRSVFPVVRVYAVDIPSFGSDWLFVLAGRTPPGRGNELFSSPTTIDERINARNIQGLRLYDGTTHVGLFHPTPAVRDLIP